MKDDIEYETIDLISNDLETLKKHYIILLEYVKKLEYKNRKLEKEKKDLEKQLKIIKKNEDMLILEELL